MWHAFPGLPGGRYRRYLSLREGSGTDKIKVPGVTLSFSPNDLGSVLAVKGPLCRFAPWTVLPAYPKG